MSPRFSLCVVRLFTCRTGTLYNGATSVLDMALVTYVYIYHETCNIFPQHIPNILKTYLFYFIFLNVCMLMV